MVKISLPPEKRIRFFVYIIESPDPADMYHNRFEGDMLQKALSLDRISSSHRIAVNEEAFRAAVLIGLLNEQMKLYKNLVPIIHISAHGSKEGLQLTSGQVITWKDLKELLYPVNEALKGALILCMSSCEGFNACRMAMNVKEEEELPFFAIIGHSGKPTWSDTAIGYAAFYHLISKGCYITDAVKAMCEASGDEGFAVVIAEKAKEAYIDVIKKKKIAAGLQRALQEESREKPPSSEATKLEKSKSNY